MAIDTNLLLYWKFSESSGNATDSISSVVLTNNNTAIYSTGKNNNCIDFGAGNTNKFLSNASTLAWNTYNTGISISFWVNFYSISAGQDIFGFQDTSWSGIFARLQSSTSIDFRFGNGISSDGGTTTATVSTLSTGTWYHIVMTHSSTANTYYVNGTQVAQRTTSVTLSGGGSGLAIGETYGAGINFTSSKVDEFGVWGRELSSSEVTQLYNSGTGLFYPFSTGNSNFFNFF